jgi:hypothetical protein
MNAFKIIDLTAPVRVKGARKPRTGIAIGRAHMAGGDIYDVQVGKKIETHHVDLLEQIGEPRPDLIRIMPLAPSEEINGR